MAAVLAIGTVGVAPARGQAQGDGEDLVGLLVGNQEITTLLVVRRGGRLWLPLADLPPFLALRPVEDGSGLKLATPLGAVPVPAAALVSINGGRYLDQRFLETRLSARITLDKAKAAIRIDLPWRGGAPRDQTDKIPRIADMPADARPPDYGVTSLHGDISYTFDTSSRTSYALAFLRATGHAYGGVWQAHYDEDFDFRRRPRDLVWMKQTSATRAVQIGHQTVALHPLLGSIEMTGVQHVWTSSPEVLRFDRFHAGALMERRGIPQRSFQGTGPVGGFAELWVDGRPAAYTQIGISGTYEFRSVVLPARQARIEIRVFDRRNPLVPVDVIRKTMSLSDLLLAKRQWAVMAGAGLGGNTFDRFEGTFIGSGRSDDTSLGHAGFALVRYAPTDRLTLEAGLASTSRETRATAGFILRLTDHALVSGAIGSGTETGLAYDVELDWQTNRWRLFARSRWQAVDDARIAVQQLSFPLEVSLRDRFNWLEGSYWSHDAELSYRMSGLLETGVLARSRPGVEFILPFVRWRPVARARIEVRPDYQGDYRFDAVYDISSRTTVGLIVSRSSALASYLRRLNAWMSLFLDVERLSDGSLRGSVGLVGSRFFDREIGWRISTLATDDGRLRLQGSLRRQLRPGVLGYVEAAYDWSQAYDWSGRGIRGQSADGLQVRLGLSFDLSPTRDGLRPASRYGMRPDQGTLSGRVQLEGAAPDTAIADIPILVDGQVVTRTKPGGYFEVQGVASGKHIVEMDESKLPIEYVPSRRAVVAAVAPGANTRFTFKADAQYGIAGQVKSTSGQPARGMSVIVLAADGKEVGRAVTNDFGYYRIDGLRNGAYRVRAVGEDGKPAGPVRAVTVSGDYAFEVDLSAATAAAKAR
ncbi:MAG: carboxypeptidase-like regulatory domain-containing protein [Hyphomicrobiaceae bacterium]